MTERLDTWVTWLLALINVTIAPRFAAAHAIAYPCFPEERLPIYLMGSNGSRVPPDVTKTFFPARSRTGSVIALNSLRMRAVSGNLPTPTSLPVSRP